MADVINYANVFVTDWHISRPRPFFKQAVYCFEYDGTSYAYEAIGGCEAFLFWVVGVIHETTAEMQNDGEEDDVFLDRVGVRYGYWSADGPAQ